MVLSDLAKSGLESAWCMDWWIQFPEQRKNITISKNKEFVGFFFRAVYHTKNPVITHPAIAAILNVISNIYNAE